MTHLSGSDKIPLLLKLVEAEAVVDTARNKANLALTEVSVNNVFVKGNACRNAQRLKS